MLADSNVVVGSALFLVSPNTMVCFLCSSSPWPLMFSSSFIRSIVCCFVLALDSCFPYCFPVLCWWTFCIDIRLSHAFVSSIFRYLCTHIELIPLYLWGIYTNQRSRRNAITCMMLLFIPMGPVLCSRREKYHGNLTFSSALNFLLDHWGSRHPVISPWRLRLNTIFCAERPLNSHQRSSAAQHGLYPLQRSCHRHIFHR